MAPTIAFVAILVAVVAAFLVGVRVAAPQSLRGAAIGAAMWIAVTGAYVAAGLPGRGAPGLAAFFGGAMIAAVALALSPLGAALAERLPLAALAGFQVFRLPLELVLHAWGEAGTMPVQMTFEGHNFDVATGVFALLVIAVAAARRSDAPRGLVLAFNVAGSALLAAVIVIVLLSSKLPIKQYEGPPILLALHLPYAWIGPVAVGGALCGHLVLWRALLGRVRREGRAPSER